MREICRICKESGGSENCRTCSVYQSADADGQSDTISEKRDNLLDYTHISEILHSYESATKKSDIDNPESAKAIYDKYLPYYHALSNKSVYNFIVKKSSELSVYPEELNNFIRTFPNYERPAKYPEEISKKGSENELAYESSKQSRTVIDDIIESNCVHIDSIAKNTGSKNKEDVNELIIKYKDYFDHVLNDVEEGLTLDDDQRKAIVTDDDHCLIVAGAGAGKTTTITAKVKYLVEVKGIRQEDIVVISYTNEATNELKDRIQKKAKLTGIKVSTIHAFAYDIIRNIRSGSGRPAPSVSIGSRKVFNDIIIPKISSDKKLLKSLVLFLGFYFDLPDDVFSFENLNEYHNYKAAQTFQTLKDRLGDYIHAVAVQREAKSKTITGEYLRSIQEVQIANFLYLYNIDYEYEKPYPQFLPRSNKMYTPDFYIWQGEHEAYLEHYGLSQNFKNSRFKPAELAKYKKSIFDKRALHKKNKTTLLETWSVYYDGKSLIEHLQKILENNGFILKLRDPKEVYDKLVETDKEKYVYPFMLFMERFIELYKSAGFSKKDFQRLREKKNPRILLFLDIAEPVYDYYQKYLSDSNQIDFADMIIEAYEYLQENKDSGNKLPYKYVIIDEFQDVAKQRFNLAKRLAEITDAKIIAVGDDWQSIFAFAGADITLFLKFIEMMGSGNELLIHHTYRNSQELIDIAGNFIQKNSSQIKKHLVSPKRINDPIVLCPYDNTSTAMINLGIQINEIIGDIIDEFGSDSTILIVGRYNFDMHNLAKSGLFTYDDAKDETIVYSKKYPEAKINFMTVHKSKGLGRDNVILLNLSEGKYGFPCQIEDDPILKLVTHEDVTIPFAEERRLFYVALTRTKNRVYVTFPKTRPSRFILELIKEHHLSVPDGINMSLIDPFKVYCPVCGYPLKYEYNKNYGMNLYICTNDPEVCNFMTNDKKHKKDIQKCPNCDDGYLVVRKSNETNSLFYGCTNYKNPEVACNYIVGILDDDDSKKVDSDES